MKTILTFFGVLFWSFLCLSLLGVKNMSAGTTKSDVATDFAELVQAQNAIQKNKEEIVKTRTQLDKDVLLQKDRASSQSIIDRDLGMIENYRAEALDDAEYLKAHSGDLTQAQKDTVAQAWLDLNNGPSTF